jgi:hypothetical protein
MKIAYFDCFAGASGDMILGALVDAGAPLDQLQHALDGLNLPNLRLSTEKVMRTHFAATKVEVHAPHEHKHRHLKDIQKILHDAALPEIVRENALKTFQRLAEAEARVHNTTPEKIHFHEVGALDAIADVVGAMAGFHVLNLEAIYCSTFSLGGGVIETEHGTIPVPGPATLELLKGFPSRPGPVDAELTTPTGAAILTTVCRNEKAPVFVPRIIGCGAGGKQFEHLPNMLRLTIGETAFATDEDTATLIETNIDNMNPEGYPYVIEQLLAAGAMDAFMAPIIMKKGRPGIMLSILTPPEKAEAVLRVLYLETTTIGARLTSVARRKLPRQLETVQSSYGPILVKIIHGVNGRRCVPEFEECRRIAESRGLPVREVQEKLLAELNEMESKPVV